MQLELSLVLGLLFGSVASIMAVLIIFEEYQKHKLGRARLWREALSGGLVAFVFFVVLSVLAGIWLYFLVK